PPDAAPPRPLLRPSPRPGMGVVGGLRGGVMGGIGGGVGGGGVGGDGGGRIGGDIAPESQPTIPTNHTNQPTARNARARTREDSDRSTGEGDDYERVLDECVKAWNESDPPTSKSLAAISVSRRKHCDAALKAGVPADFLIEVIRREAPAGTQPWKIRQMAVQEFRNKRPWEMGQKKQDGVPNAGAYELVDPHEVQEFAKLMYGDA